MNSPGDTFARYRDLAVENIRVAMQQAKMRATSVALPYAKRVLKELGVSAMTLKPAVTKIIETMHAFASTYYPIIAVVMTRLFARCVTIVRDACHHFLTILPEPIEVACRNVLPHLVALEISLVAVKRDAGAVVAASWKVLVVAHATLGVRLGPYSAAAVALLAGLLIAYSAIYCLRRALRKVAHTLMLPT